MAGGVGHGGGFVYPEFRSLGDGGEGEGEHCIVVFWWTLRRKGRRILLGIILLLCAINMCSFYFISKFVRLV